MKKSYAELLPAVFLHETSQKLLGQRKIRFEFILYFLISSNIVNDRMRFLRSNEVRGIHLMKFVEDT